MSIKLIKIFFFFFTKTIITKKIVKYIFFKFFEFFIKDKAIIVSFSYEIRTKFKKNKTLYSSYKFVVKKFKESREIWICKDERNVKLKLLNIKIVKE